MKKTIPNRMRGILYHTSIGLTCQQLTFIDKHRLNIYKSTSEYVRFLVAQDMKKSNYKERSK